MLLLLILLGACKEGSIELLFLALQAISLLAHSLVLFFLFAALPAELFDLFLDGWVQARSISLHWIVRKDLIIISQDGQKVYPP